MAANAVWTMFCLTLAAPTAAPESPKTPPVLIEHEDRQVEGWTVRVDRRLLAGPDEGLGADALRLLADRLRQIVLVLPADRIDRLRRVRIWLDLDHPLERMQYHPGAGWLREHGYDPEMEKGVHIPGAGRFVQMARDNAQPAVVLHELAHAYHDQVLSFDSPRVREAYERVKKSKQLESVLHINGRKIRHYALTNPMEFFAEMSEAYLGTNDFYPFVRSELRESDPETFDLLAEIWRTEALAPATASGPPSNGTTSAKD